MVAFPICLIVETDSRCVWALRERHVGSPPTAVELDVRCSMIFCSVENWLGCRLQALPVWLIETASGLDKRRHDVIRGSKVEDSFETTVAAL